MAMQAMTESNQGERVVRLLLSKQQVTDRNNVALTPIKSATSTSDVENLVEDLSVINGYKDDFLICMNGIEAWVSYAATLV